VPIRMAERYVIRSGEIVGGEATYTNFRQFETSARIIPWGERLRDRRGFRPVESCPSSRKRHVQTPRSRCRARSRLVRAGFDWETMRLARFAGVTLFCSACSRRAGVTDRSSALFRLSSTSRFQC